MRRRNDGAAVAMTAMLVSGMLLLSACGSADAVKTDATGATEEMAQTGQAAACVVTYYDSDGKTVLQTEEVEKGACAKEYTPEKDGSIFVGWFATPQMSHKFDFSQAVTEDTSVIPESLRLWEAARRRYFWNQTGEQSSGMRRR